MKTFLTGTRTGALLLENPVVVRLLILTTLLTVWVIVGASAAYASVEMGG